MTKLLVSVRSAAEARDAIAGGADVIDVKEPANGPLGAASPAVWREVAERVAAAPQCTLSLATGELLQAGEEALQSLHSICDIFAGRNPVIVKAGLAGCGAKADWRQQVASWSRKLPPHAQPALAAYADFNTADSPSPLEVINAATRENIRFALLDTFDKQAGSLLTHLTIDDLQTWVANARQAGIAVAIAGSLPRAVPTSLLQLQPDYIAVRGAVCDGDRLSQVRKEYVTGMAQQLRATA